jgi:hypothetical protein
LSSRVLSPVMPVKLSLFRVKVQRLGIKFR